MAHTLCMGSVLFLLFIEGCLGAPMGSESARKTTTEWRRVGKLYILNSAASNSVHLRNLLQKNSTEVATLSPSEQRQLDQELLNLAGSPENSTTKKDVDELLSEGANPDACCNNFGGTALHRTTEHDNAIVAMGLVDAGANIHGKDSMFEDMPLHDAAIHNAAGVAEVLIDAGAELDPKDGIGVTPLHQAAEWGSVEVAELLITAGANVSAVTGDGLTPADLLCNVACSDDARKRLAPLLSQNASTKMPGAKGDVKLEASIIPEKKDNSFRLTPSAAPKKSSNATMEDEKIAEGSLTAPAQEDANAEVLFESLMQDEDLDQKLLDLAAQPPNTTTEEAINDLLSRGANPDACCTSFGGTALHMTSGTDNDIVATALIEAGANISARDAELGDTPLHDAVLHNAIQVGRALIIAGADVNAADNSGETPLHRAAEWGNAVFAELLLVSGANKSASSNAREAPADVICESACPGGARQRLEILFSHDSEEAPPKYEELDEELLRISAGPESNSTKRDVLGLLSKGANPDACCSKFGGRALHATTLKDNTIAAVALIAAGANVDGKDTQFGDTPLHDAAIHNAVRVAKLLIAARADVNARDEGGETPLHHAAEWGSFKVAQVLVTAGANKSIESGGSVPTDLICEASCPGNARQELNRLLLSGLHRRTSPGDNSTVEVHAGEATTEGSIPIGCCEEGGATALHVASESGNAAEASALIEGGADVNARDDAGLTPLHLAKSLQIAKILITAGAEVDAVGDRKETPLHLQAKVGTVDVDEMLLKSGANVNAVDGMGETPLHESAERGLLPVVQLLVKWGADVDAFYNPGGTPLHQAAHFGHTEVAKYLLAEGADPNSNNAFGEKPLHIAAKLGISDICQLLVDSGADVNATDSKRETPLHEAAERGLVVNVRCLLEAGVDKSALDMYGNAAIDVICSASDECSETNNDGEIRNLLLGISCDSCA